MKKTSRKLELKRETVQPLTHGEMYDVNGGTIGPIVTASIRFCKYTDKIVKATVPVVKATKWALDHGGPANTGNISGRGECTA